MLSLARRLIKIVHPEAIPWPGTVLYNAISESRIFQRNYELVARDILCYCPEGRILDVGTGPGWLLAELHRQRPGLQITGLDASRSMVARARKNMARLGLSSLIQIEEAYANSMPFPDGSFDAVVSTGSIHHWKDPTAGLNETHRVLRPGGYALMYDLVSDPPASVLKEAAREFGRFRVLLLWLHGFEEPFYSCRDFESLARPTLFREGRIRFVGVLCCLIMQKEPRLHA